MENVIPLSFTDENTEDETLGVMDKGFVARARNRDYALTMRILGNSRGYDMSVDWDGDRDVWVIKRVG